MLNLVGAVDCFIYAHNIYVSFHSLRHSGTAWKYFFISKRSFVRLNYGVCLLDKIPSKHRFESALLFRRAILIACLFFFGIIYCMHFAMAIEAVETSPQISPMQHVSQHSNIASPSISQASSYRITPKIGEEDLPWIFLCFPVNKQTDDWAHPFFNFSSPIENRTFRANHQNPVCEIAMAIKAAWTNWMASGENKKWMTISKINVQ